MDALNTLGLPAPLKVTPVQTDLHWLDPVANRRALAQKFESLKGRTDLIVLPEMFTSGFTIEPEQMHDQEGIVTWLKDQSRYLGAAITGSVACDVSDSNKSAVDASDSKPQFVNRMLFVTPEGDVMHYDKTHLFQMADEHKRYRAGNKRCIITYKGWRILLTVCYDLRFPVFCRNRNDYDLMLCVANWPSARAYHWRSLLVARAIENQAYVVGVNRVGTDGKGLEYTGDSLVVDHLGQLLVDKPGEWMETLALDSAELCNYRERFPAWQDADDFIINNL